ncbi:lipoprotein, putative [plant metagenome]|uniref:Lipoprotein, putative n=1 Tax=plant metagenome TaxID=1297885 RepID=A0A484QBJ9_9ZZZZ
MLRASFIATSLLVLAGCATQAPAPAPTTGGSTPSGVTPPPPPPEVPSASQEPVERLRGAYSKTQGWTLCGQTAPSALQTPLRSELDAFAPGTDSYFLDGWGRRGPQGVELVSVERMHTEGPGCEEPLDGFVWVAHGQEPFWAFGVTTSGIRFKPEGEPSRTYAYVKPEIVGQQLVYRGADFELVLNKEGCQSTMADARYAWAARLQADGRSWQGCAWQGLQSEGEEKL